MLTGIPTGNSNEGNKFCFTFLHNTPVYGSSVKYLKIFIGTKENETVQYRIRSGVTVVNRNGTVNPGQITVEQYTIYETGAQSIESIPGNDTNNKFTGIIVETVNSTQKIVVTAFSSNAVSGLFDGFCAIPIIDYPGFNINGDHPYTYTAFSTKGIGSAMLAMVVCNNLEANDVIITHVSLDNISDVYFLETGQSKAWDTYTTAMVASTSDITGVYVLSNQPIGVIVGHECGGSDLVCDYITEQIPPSYTWGYNFFITPFIDHTEMGYVLKVLPRYNNTNCTLYCMDSNGVTYDIIVHNLMKSEAMITDRTYFNINSQSHCCIKSDRPLAVMQYSKSSYKEKSIGGPSMVWIAPVSQYLNNHLFSNVISIQTTFNVISVTVLSQCFNTSYITINGTHLELYVTNWTPIYCTNTSTSACGYGINKAIDKGTHIVRHSIATCHINVIVYGWGRKKGYAYPAGYGMNPVGGKYIQLYITIILLYRNLLFTECTQCIKCSNSKSI